MSQEEIVVELQQREVIRKGLGALRSSGTTPAVIHNHGKPSIHVMGNTMSLVKVYQQAGKHHAVQLKIDGKEHLALIKDVDFEPKKNRMRHIVFQAINQNEKVQTEIPVVLEGEIPAEKAGLMVLSNISHVIVEALPKNLPDQIVLDASKLAEIGDKLTVADLQAIEGVVVITEPETTLAVVEETKAQISEESTEEEAAEGEAAEGEEAGESSETAEATKSKD